MTVEHWRITWQFTLLVIATVAVATSSAESNADLPNWVSPVNASESACYRKTYLSTKTCATGYESDHIATCWAQCPLNYPVECGMECIPQSADCTSEVLTKVKSVATVALNAATAGVFGQFLKASEAIQLGVKCGQKLFTATSSLVSYVKELQTNETQSQQLISLVNQSDLVVNELPAAVYTCLNIPVNTDNLETRAEIANVVKQIVTTAIEDGTSLLNPSNFLAFIKDLGVDDSVQDLDQDSLAQLQDVLTSGATCGTKLQAIIHKVTQFVVDAKSGNPATTISAIRQALSVSELFLSDIPAVTNNCVRNLTDDAFSTRDSLRTVMSTITDGLVDGSVDDDGKSISTVDYLAKVADMGLDVIALFDPTGIADMMSTFIQPICGPTAFMGEIDDGSLDDALALTTEGYAFEGSYGTWSKVGDGSVTVIFESFDSKDVTVHIHSGGDTVAKVDVGSGETVTWNSTVKELQDKTLYMDRWRAGLLGLPGSDGGSLLMWVPHSSEGGKIVLHVEIHDEDDDTSVDGSNEAGVEQKDGSNEGSDAEITTPAPVATKGEDQIDQSSLSSSGSEEDITFPPTPTAAEDDSATPAPTTLGDGSATPSPTTPISVDPTQQGSEDSYCQS
ncbi:hypothetical protein L917_18127 [Phytophthora nicotianae]|uniref:Uncharacterized protein n=1 Tax=Phytophthora nicotianae TaxID=4792 RepID=A0A0W8CLX2_PHYNI|nr:hypothetical protein L917_18127 [Phytophthora nicotianae]KUF79723.1 hypothetical protein AM587_10011573 [Phytophthora nicotianae]KUF85159.1 hypothetical protein AM587_10006470 [Phytophthora nicotianae]